MKRPVWAALVFASACLPTLPGCGGGGPPLVAVTGTVTQDGKPLEGATVVFAPDASNQHALIAEDVTGPDGDYKLTTRGRFGAVPGKYHVVVKKTPAVPDAAAAANPAFVDDPYMASLSAGVAPNSKKKGADFAPLEFTIEREITQESPQVQDIDVDLKAMSSKSKGKSLGGKLKG